MIFSTKKVCKICRDAAYIVWKSIFSKNAKNNHDKYEREVSIFVSVVLYFVETLEILKDQVKKDIPQARNFRLARR